MNESEERFVALCDAAGIAVERVAEGEDRAADFIIRTGELTAVVEVKQFEPNAEERRALEAAERGEAVAVGGAPGARVRSAIDSASRQLKNVAAGELPTMVVLYDTMLFRHAGAYNIKVAMYGFDTIVMGVPKGSSPPFLIDRKSGAKRRMTETCNTSISAVADMLQSGDLSIYHNEFAAMPIDPASIRREGFRHFRLARGEQGCYDEWEEC